MVKQLKTSIISVLVITLFTGFVFPGVITVIGKALFPWQADGSFVNAKGQPVSSSAQDAVGSALIGQGFSTAKYFQPRPSAAGSGYDPTSSGGTNLGPTSDKLINGIHKTLPNGKSDSDNFDGIRDLAAEYRKTNNLSPNAPVPQDAVTRSASGLDPDISPENAYLQAPRVAAARGMPVDAVLNLVKQHIDGRTLGFMGSPRVNVLELNISLDQMGGGKA